MKGVQKGVKKMYDLSYLDEIAYKSRKQDRLVQAEERADNLEKVVKQLYEEMEKLKTVLPPKKLPASRGAVVSWTAKKFNISKELMLSKSKRMQPLLARCYASYLMKKHMGTSLSNIGKALNRDHSTIHHGILKVEGMMLDGYEFPEFPGIAGNE